VLVAAPAGVAVRSTRHFRLPEVAIRESILLQVAVDRRAA